MLLEGFILLWKALSPPQRGFISVNSNDCRTPNKPAVFLTTGPDFGVVLIRIHAFVSSKRAPAAAACTNVAPRST